MKWQKARGVNDGFEFWVEVGRPFLDDGIGLDGEHRAPRPLYRTNVVVSLTPPLKQLRIEARAAELLPEFSDDAPLVTLAEFAAQEATR